MKMYGDSSKGVLDGSSTEKNRNNPYQNARTTMSHPSQKSNNQKKNRTKNKLKNSRVRSTSSTWIGAGCQSEARPDRWICGRRHLHAARSISRGNKFFPESGSALGAATRAGRVDVVGIRGRRLSRTASGVARSLAEPPPAPSADRRADLHARLRGRRAAPSARHLDRARLSSISRKNRPELSSSTSVRSRPSDWPPAFSEAGAARPFVFLEWKIDAIVRRLRPVRMNRQIGRLRAASFVHRPAVVKN